MNELFGLPIAGVIAFLGILLYINISGRRNSNKQKVKNVN